ncbi:MAG: hypothetical protein AAFW76_05960, partial [Pseudomonadota bacterium]
MPKGHLRLVSQMVGLVLAAVFLLVAPLSSVRAQDATAVESPNVESQGADAPGEPASPERIERLIGTLQDDQARAALIEQLELLVQAENARTGETDESLEALQVIDNVGGRAVDMLAVQVSTTRDRLADIVGSLSLTPAFISWLGRQFQQADVRGAIQWAVFELALTFGFGAFAAWIVRRVTRGIWPDRDGDEGRSIDVVILRAMGRIILSVLALGLFAAVSYAVIIFITEGAVVRRIAIGLVLVIAIHQTIMFIIGELLRPRYVRLSKDRCLWLAVRMRRLASISIFGYFAVTTIASVGLPYYLTDVVSNLLGLVAKRIRRITISTT